MKIRTEVDRSGSGERKQIVAYDDDGGRMIIWSWAEFLDGPMPLEAQQIYTALTGWGGETIFPGRTCGRCGKAVEKRGQRWYAVRDTERYSDGRKVWHAGTCPEGTIEDASHRPA